MWNQIDLQRLVKEKLSDYLFVVVSNREPYIHTYAGDKIECIVPASGLTSALDPVMRACGGTWVAHGSGSADKEVVDSKNSVLVPPESGSYKLRRVWLTDDDVDRYYLGFSNEAMWPLCHIVFQRPKFDDEDWYVYKNVNRLFADAVLEEIGNLKAFVFIQDYHLTLVSRLIKAKNPRAITAQFWHIPWPNREAFRVCPWQNEILYGLLGNDLLGFHIAYHRHNFLETVDRALECRIDNEKFSVTHGNHTTYVKPFPISVDFDAIAEKSQAPEVEREMMAIKSKFGITDEIIGIGLDRIDYTKGIPERLKAIDALLTKYPKYKYKNRITFFQLGEPSRVKIKKYEELNIEIDRLVADINSRHQTDGWQPIIYIKEHKSPVTLLAFNRLARFCIVSSLHDGMNLVAKEFISSRTDEDGVLILSRFTGAARELGEALLVNPYAIEDIAETIEAAIEMPEELRRKRMIKLRNIVRENNVYRWAADIITELVRIESI
ncbi:MAG: trehalose-6-phosphate synthase [Dehalococcoidia bacterium]|nr:MAG: trehalose-6-phosphate synthase [Dehalococcoidia bacterium]